ncbi:MAG: RNA-binding transcriptional accessory protein, partial [Oscillospiraceae bacterium]|nr:RNA-binding transcriptional accessory protein [Oscillospiraceae bacterium]
MDVLTTLAGEFHLKPEHIGNVITLIDDGNTIPFIARYRKELTGSMDDQVLREVELRLQYLRNLNEQREKVRAVITEQGAMTDEIAAALDAAATLTEIDDIYRPYRPKRKTRASVAKAKGLQPLAEAIYAQEDGVDPAELAAEYLSEEHGISTAGEALQGARDIIAEMISDEASGRRRLRVVCMANGSLTSKGEAADLGVYEMYREFTDPLAKIAGYRV